MLMFDTVATGGTFDILHKGHYALLLKAFEVGKFVIIGMSSDKYVTLKKKKITNKYSVRLKNLKRFIKQEFNKFNYSIYELNDFYGPTILTKEIQAIVTTETTKENCIKINELRSSKDLPKLEIIVVPLVGDKQGKVISSTRIREGEIDINGKKLTS
ncbi:MAG: pantetheine-phosphate adenylyltransferase [Thaumarchaeota archaeon]|nr:MAG: pantetheine-phosphate adenylyltransferase [Nitrososphaerota archaeon]TLX90640.1 MAG: pantetheine-phosphate adenylyltransferase [Nitrososphaerota archaeon]